METLQQFVRCVRFAGDGRNSSMPNGTELIQHVPSRAPLAYLHNLFPPLSESKIQELDSLVGGLLTDDYQEFLSQVNGVNLYSTALSLYGFRDDRVGSIEASRGQPFDLVAANTLEFRPLLELDQCAVGSYNWDSSRIVTSLKCHDVYRCENKTMRVLNRWPSLACFLVIEFNRIRNHFDESGIRIDPNRPTVPEHEE